MAILNNSNAISTGGYDINNSLRFRSSASAYLNRTPASTTNQTTWTWSSWVKRGTLSVLQDILSARIDGSNYFRFAFNASDQLTVDTYWSASQTILLTTTQVFRDPSAWYHIVLSIDSTQSTSSNRAKLYVNGSQITSFATATYPAQNNSVSPINTANIHNIGRYPLAVEYIDGYIAEVNFIDGQALTPSSFGETDTITGSWKPKPYSGTYGTNGFYLKFSDIATTSGSNAGLGKDFSGNSNYWTTNNISVTSGTTYDAMKDSPTNTSATVGNYCTLNPVFGSTNVTLSEANLKAQVGSTGGVYRTAAATFGVSSGKWYWELVFGNPTTGNPLAGVGDMTVATSTWNADTSTNANFWYVDGSNGNKINGTGGPGSSYGSSFSTTDICMVALDMDNGKIWWGKNGTWFASGDPAAGTNAAYTNLANKLLTIALMGGCGSCGFSGNLYQLNFGQRPFSYSAPSGFVALNTYNLPTPTILQGNKYMDANLWTGNGSTQTIVNQAQFKPDFVWIKSRSSTEGHALTDSVRGSNYRLFSESTSAEDNVSTLTSFNSNGFSVSVAGGASGRTNYNGYTYVGWQWQAGQGSTSSNTSGSITSTVSANTTAGFSIVTYTGVGSSPKTVGHGLGVAPKMILLKSRGASVNWYVWHTSLGATQVIEGLNTTGVASSQITFNNTLPTSSVISLGNNDSNNNGSTYVLYVWAEIAGFSKFGSYTGNGSSDGVFVYLGFRPKYVMIKNSGGGATSSLQGWIMMDTSRSTYNQTADALFTNNSNASNSGTSYAIDILSNGFKTRGTDGSVNESSATYIYMAFAENPFKNANAR